MVKIDYENECDSDNDAPKKPFAQWANLSVQRDAGRSSRRLALDATARCLGFLDPRLHLAIGEIQGQQIAFGERLFAGNHTALLIAGNGVTALQRLL